MIRTHSTEDTSHVCDEVELGLSRDHTGAFDCLERHRFETGVHQSQTWVVVVGLRHVTNSKTFLSQRASVYGKRRLNLLFSFWRRVSLSHVPLKFGLPDLGDSTSRKPSSLAIGFLQRRRLVQVPP